MSDVIGRGAFEEQLAKVLGREFSKQRKEIIRLLGDPPNPNNIPIEYWENGGKQIRDAVEPLLQKIYLSQAEIFMNQLTIGIDWGLANTGAITWARDYTFELVTGLTETTRNGISTAIQGFFEQPTTLQQLIDKLDPYFGPVRAEMIAITEVTRAASNGESQVIKQIIERNPGMEAVSRWITYKDDRVCTICLPLHNVETTEHVDGIAIWEHPELDDTFTQPAHPRCRCYKRTTFRSKK